MKQSTIKQQKEAVKWFMNDITFNQRIAIANQYFPQYAEDNIDLEDEEIAHIYLSEHPQPTYTGNTVSSEVGLKLWVTGSGNRAGLNKNDVLLRTDDATIHLSKDSEFGKLAHAMIDRYNNHDKLVSALKGLIIEATNSTKDIISFNGADDLDAAIDQAKQLLNNISNK